ncbi:DUF4041 domain-containing protein [Litorihabitans aurantiacus]|uniref:Bacteriophage T5 Orf172 DNA-binding domain-containing protein n=1 Tax=Litorihabitans aurantiacus TaxID=1930061 RepID=A0AA37XI04_9MICO|nr:DUF4041 domain-containing protein [Litorihabitans aurantiacus]GMA33705.1 hypothetical protein GCM10025875_36970 [Litorihabitans aurantiacus]GMA33768.1 hypothetical protein GCM10025875_37600 [Litorihabitans aurantiacus]
MMPANWYLDPDDASLQRWWDGERWTQDRRALQDEPRPPDAPAEFSFFSGKSAAAAWRQRAEFFTARYGAERAKLEQVVGELVQARGALSRVKGMELIEVEAEIARRRGELESLTAEVAGARSVLQREREQVLEVRSVASLQDVSLFDFDHVAEGSASLANRLSEVRVKYKQLIKESRATSYSESFTFNGSAAKGKTFAKNMAKTMLAAYNAEAENAIKAVRAGGLDTARARLDRVVDRVERNGAMIDLKINAAYHRLRLEELTLAERHLHAVKVEKELERERRAELREQAKAEAELAKEKERLDKERNHYLNVIEALRQRGDEAEAAKIEAKLADVDRAIQDVDYRAANIRAGYVYVISNLGAMGERMVKIGMTRRLDPMDRVKELGDASVPFPFDVHALFFAEDAVGIENMLHRTFAEQRVNRINQRREFFYTTPTDVLDALQSHGVSLVEYAVEPEAEQYRLSIAAAGA